MICTIWLLISVKGIYRTVIIYGPHMKNPRIKAFSPRKKQMSLNEVISVCLNDWHSLIYSFSINSYSAPFLTQSTIQNAIYTSLGDGSGTSSLTSRFESRAEFCFIVTVYCIQTVLFFIVVLLMFHFLYLLFKERFLQTQKTCQLLFMRFGVNVCKKPHRLIGENIITVIHSNI